MFGGNFAPAGWMFCEGQLLSIAEYETLYNLIGTRYGGDGVSTYALPDLRGRIPVHNGSRPGDSTYTLGENAGSETATLTIQQIPSHSHTVMSRGEQGNTSNPVNAVPAMSSLAAYSNGADSAVSGSAMHASAVGGSGGSQPHDNMMPYLCVSFIISLFGVYPSQN
ncbi:phage tail protein [Paenibacillus sp. NPDC058174]|uniref:phage tail protein n=1 Tax=Paenibacillus sp. NPDC058174 TaxID=3346366 RepID=UPI0036D814C8